MTARHHLLAVCAPAAALSRRGAARTRTRSRRTPRTPKTKQAAGANLAGR